MRKNIAAGNWKMNKAYDEGIQLATTIKNSDKASGVEVIMAVPYIFLKSVSDLLNDAAHVNVAAQNCHQKASGAYTGEISAGMLSSMKVPYVVLGHSERREYFGESDILIGEKMLAAHENGIKVIYCCGEPLEVRKKGDHIDYVTKQIKNTFSMLSKEQLSATILAYEPIWAIGTGETATPQQAQEMHKAIRVYVADNFGEDIADNMSILYGGSVKPANAKELFSCPDVDGGLVGGASLKADDFNAIINSF